MPTFFGADSPSNAETHKIILPCRQFVSEWIRMFSIPLSSCMTIKYRFKILQTYHGSSIGECVKHYIITVTKSQLFVGNYNSTILVYGIAVIITIYHDLLEYFRRGRCRFVRESMAERSRLVNHIDSAEKS